LRHDDEHPKTFALEWVIKVVVWLTIVAWLALEAGLLCEAGSHR
jgi:hypothetical protein